MIPCRSQFCKSVEHGAIHPTRTATYDDKRLRGKSEQSAFVIVLFANLIGGEKIVVEVENIPVYYDTIIPLCVSVRKYRAHIERTVPKVFRTDIVHGKPNKGYHTRERAYVRVYFRTATDRKYALGVRTYDTVNDTAMYEHMVYATHKIAVSSWLKVKLSPLNDPNYKVRAFSVDLADIETIATPSDEMNTHNSLVCAYDIEVAHEHEGMPRAEIDPISSISLTYHWNNTDMNQRILAIAVTTSNVGDKKYPTTDLAISYATEKDMLLAFFATFTKMQPDFITGFNSGGFDDPYIMGRIQTYGDSFVNACFVTASPYHKFRFRTYWPNSPQNIKVATMGGNMSVHLINFSGAVNFDVRPAATQLVQRVCRTSLKAFLNLWNLPNKIDMPIPHMNKLFRENMPDGIFQVLEYNIHDSQSCFNIIKFNNFLTDRRSIAATAYVPVDHAIFRADIGRVINLIHSNAISMGQMMTTVFGTDDGVHVKFKGAHVLKPKLGLQTIKPCLYERAPPHKQAEFAEIKRMVTPELYSLAVVKTEYCDLPVRYSSAIPEPIYECIVEHAKTRFGTPVTSLDFESLYPSLMIALNISYDMICAISNPLAEQAFRKYFRDELDEFNIIEISETLRVAIRKHNNDPDKYGIIARVEHKLKEARVAMKRLWGEYIKRCESEPDPNGILLVWKNYYFIRQNAMKTFMNSIYGATGKTNSPLYLREVSSSITYYGRTFLLATKKFIEELMFHGHPSEIVYGDTDSLYIQFAQELYADIESRFYGSCDMQKNEFVSQLIARAQTLTDELSHLVNAFIVSLTGNTVLKMAYEEILYPAVWFTPKKYIGIQYVKSTTVNLMKGSEYITNFNRVLNINIAKDTPLFIRGFDIIKRGLSEFSRQFVLSIIFTFLDVNNIRTIRELVDDKLAHMFEHEYDIQLFDRNAKYNAGKTGTAADFGKYMRENHPNDAPNAGEYFSYIIREGTEDAKWKLWTLTHIAERDGIVPNKYEYYRSEIVGLVSRLIACDADFGSNDAAKYYLRKFYEEKKPEMLASRIAKTLTSQRTTTEIARGLTCGIAIEDIVKQCEDAREDINVGVYLAEFTRIICAVYGTSAKVCVPVLFKHRYETARTQMNNARANIVRYTHTHRTTLEYAISTISKIMRYCQQVNQGASAELRAVCAMCEEYRSLCIVYNQLHAVYVRMCFFAE